MVFTKMHGCGNDYIYIDCTKEFVENEEKAAIILSDRHFGVGGDGIILIKKAQKQILKWLCIMQTVQGCNVRQRNKMRCKILL